MNIEHGGNRCGYDRTKWFKCGACHRKVCWCFGGDSSLRSFVNLCNECWGHATAQAEREGIDPENETVAA